MTRFIFVLCLALACIAPASAHELRPAYLDVRETDGGTFNVLFKVPARGDLRLSLRARLPDSCEALADPVKYIEDSAYFERWSVACADGLKGKTIRIEGLSSTLTDSLVRIAFLDGATETVRLKGDRPEFIVKGRPAPLEVALTYFWLGVEHILGGLDHLLFVVSLLLLRSNLRTLVMTISSFTVAHSITLSGAALGYLSLPQQPVEVLVACSIVFVAAELLKADPANPRLSERSPWLIAFPFGLLHGFGFAGALKEIGLPQTDVPLALLTFNLGVEAGQLLFVLALLTVWKAASTVLTVPLAPARMIVAYGIGCIAAVWAVFRFGEQTGLIS